MTGGFFPIFTIMAFIAVVLMLEGLYLIWNSYRGPEAKKIEQRLRALSAGSDSSERVAVLRNRMLSEVPAIARLLLGIPRIHNVDRLLVQSGLEWTVAKLLAISLPVGATAYFMARLSLSAVLATMHPARRVAASRRCRRAESLPTRAAPASAYAPTF